MGGLNARLFLKYLWRADSVPSHAHICSFSGRVAPFEQVFVYASSTQPERFPRRRPDACSHVSGLPYLLDRTFVRHGYMSNDV